MRIAQITDLHIGEAGERPFDVDVRINFLNVLHAVKALNADHIILSGDLCLRAGEMIIYKWIKFKLTEIGISYDLVPGNHDNPVLLTKAFDKEKQLQNEELFFAKQIDRKPAFFLDTTTGVLSQQQCEWLCKNLQNVDQEALIFMHHPPVLGGVPHMDNNYPLQNREEVQQIFFAHPHPITVFCGHYHVEKTITKNNLTVHITPSTYFQIDQFQQEFAIDSKAPGFRIIDIQNGQISHTVRYLTSE